MYTHTGLLKHSLILSRVIVLTLAVSLINANASGDDNGHEPLPLEAGRELPYPLRGVTADSSYDDLDDLVNSLSSLSSAPIVRLVFDPGLTAGDFEDAIDSIRPYAWIMGQLADSTAMRDYTAEQLRQRASDFLEAYGERIDIWEIGNELNGAWTGDNPEEINAKIKAAYDVVANIHHRKTLITLNYWSGANCYEKEWEPTLIYAKTLPPEIRNGVDYVMLSIYEDSCSPPQHPTAMQIGQTLVELGKIFPNAKLGIGEIGAQNAPDSQSQNHHTDERVVIAEKYDGMQSELEKIVGKRFIGGYFWWYYCEDAVPKDKENSLWPLLDELLWNLQ